MNQLLFVWKKKTSAFSRRFSECDGYVCANKYREGRSLQGRRASATEASKPARASVPPPAGEAEIVN